MRYLESDFADPDAPAAFVAAAREACGHIDLLIVNHARSPFNVPVGSSGLSGSCGFDDHTRPWIIREWRTAVALGEVTVAFNDDLFARFGRRANPFNDRVAAGG